MAAEFEYVDITNDLVLKRYQVRFGDAVFVVDPNVYQEQFEGPFFDLQEAQRDASQANMAANRSLTIARAQWTAADPADVEALRAASAAIADAEAAQKVARRDLRAVVTGFVTYLTDILAIDNPDVTEQDVRRLSEARRVQLHGFFADPDGSEALYRPPQAPVPASEPAVSADRAA